MIEGLFKSEGLVITALQNCPRKNDSICCIINPIDLRRMASEQEKLEDIFETNKQMTKWMIGNFARLKMEYCGFRITKNDLCFSTLTD